MKATKCTFFASSFFFFVPSLELLLLPAGSGLPGRDTKSGPNMSDQRGKEILQVGNIHPQHGSPRVTQGETRQDNRNHLSALFLFCSSIFFLLLVVAVLVEQQPCGSVLTLDV